MTLSTTLLWALFSIVSSDWAVSASGLDSVQLDSFSNSSGLWRPQVHFSPPQVCATPATDFSVFSCSFFVQNWMNDPNGLHIDANGTYHLYYQCRYL